MDSDLLQQFYLRYSREIYLYLYSLCRNRELAEDLMQEVFLRALLSWKEDSGNLRAWLYKVARNACLNALRRDGRETDLERIKEAGQEMPELDRLLWEEQKKELYRALLTLPERQREILELYYFSGMSIREIAHFLKLTPENVRVLSYRAKRALKAYLKEKGYES